MAKSRGLPGKLGWAARACKDARDLVRCARYPRKAVMLGPVHTTVSLP